MVFFSMQGLSCDESHYMDYHVTCRELEFVPAGLGLRVALNWRLCFGHLYYALQLDICGFGGIFGFGDLQISRWSHYLQQRKAVTATEVQILEIMRATIAQKVGRSCVNQEGL